MGEAWARGIVAGAYMLLSPAFACRSIDMTCTEQMHRLVLLPAQSQAVHCNHAPHREGHACLADGHRVDRFGAVSRARPNMAGVVVSGRGAGQILNVSAVIAALVLYFQTEGGSAYLDMVGVVLCGRAVSCRVPSGQLPLLRHRRRHSGGARRICTSTASAMIINIGNDSQRLICCAVVRAGNGWTQAACNRHAGR